MQDGQIDSLRTNVTFGTLEGDVFANDDARYFVQQCGTGTHGTGREGGVKRTAGVNIGCAPSGIFQTVHLSMVNDAALLDALIVSATDDFAIADKDGADGNTAGGETFVRLIDSS